jgi:hypothetical protein
MFTRAHYPRPWVIFCNGEEILAPSPRNVNYMLITIYVPSVAEQATLHTRQSLPMASVSDHCHFHFYSPQQHTDMDMKSLFYYKRLFLYTSSSQFKVPLGTTDVNIKGRKTLNRGI